MNLVQLLQASCERFGNKIAIVHGERRLSYTELDVASSRLAGALQTIGMRKNDRIAVLMGNSIEYLVVYLGIIKIGAIAVLLDTKYKSGEIDSLLSDCKPRIIISESSVLEPLNALLAKLDYIELILDAGHSAASRHIKLDAFLTANGKAYLAVTIDEADPAHIAYTSGPSFSPLGVITPHGNLVREIMASAESFNQKDTDIVVQFALPLHHVIGLVVVMLTSLYCGSKVIILNGVSIDSLTAAIEHHKVTMFTGVPFIHAMLLRKVRDDGLKHDLSSLRFTGSAGDILPFDTVEQYRKTLNLRLVNFYGLTETLGHVTCEIIGGIQKPGCVGKALRGWEIKIIDKSGGICSPGQQGEVIIRGPFMSGYYGKQETTSQVIKNGWLHTGDRGYLDEEGNLYILGLLKDMLICKGQNIFPSDIEHVLSLHESVADVAAVGVPDAIRGEVVGAAVVLHKGHKPCETTLQKYCLAKMANYKTPKYFVFMESLPTDNEGKIDKNSIRECFISHRKSHALSDI